MNAGDIDILRALADLGATAYLLLSIWALVTERVVPGARLKATKEECAEAKAALQSRLDAATAIQARTIEQQSTIIEASLPALRAFQEAKKP